MDLTGMKHEKDNFCGTAAVPVIIRMIKDTAGFYTGRLK